MEKPVTIARLKKMKSERAKIAVVTAYDYPSALLADLAGVDMILVGDSLGNVVLGYDTTVPVTLEMMIHHTKAVTKAVKRSFVVTDMPFLSAHGSLDKTLANAGRIMQEGLAKAVKMEGGKDIVPAVKTCVRAGIPVMGHLGLTPQSVHQIGGYFIQGKTAEKAQELIDDAKRLEEAGAFSLVLELIPAELASRITEQLSIPTIGIGAGMNCDGQVLVFHDLLQYGAQAEKRFVKTYANIGETIKNALFEYVRDVKQQKFPEEKHEFHAEHVLASNVYGASRQKGE